MEKSYENSLTTGKMVEKVKKNKDKEKRNSYRPGLVGRAMRIKN